MAVKLPSTWWNPGRTMAGQMIVALDVGTHRIGVATGWSDVRIAQPLITLDHTADIAERILDLLDTNQASKLVIGLPRNLNGDDTAQTGYVREFTTQLQANLKLPLIFQDEALSSSRAEAELAKRGKTYAKGEVDALAAAFILEDYFETMKDA